MTSMKRKQAAAIRYDPDRQNAPVLTARGEGHMAEKILEIAREENIPVIQDPVFTGQLMGMEPGSELPEELYEAAARIVAFVWRMRQEYSPPK